MSFATVALHYEIPGMRIHSSLLGSSVDLTLHGSNCRVIFPDANYDEESSIWNVRFPVIGRGATLDEYYLNEMRIEVQVQVGDGAISILPDGEESVTLGDAEIQSLFDTAEPIADEILRLYLDQVRTRFTQRGLRSTSTVHRAIHSEAHDADGRPLGSNLHGTSRIGPTVMSSGELSLLNQEKHSEILGHVQEGLAIDLADTLLADAHFTFGSKLNPNYRQALLLAVIACEVKVKTLIFRIAKPEQKELVKLLLENPRDFSVQAISLFDKGLHAVCGRSLRIEQKEVYKKLQTMIAIRNSIAHRGGADDYVPRDDDLESWAIYIRTATDVVAYLEQVEADLNAPG